MVAAEVFHMTARPAGLRARLAAVAAAVALLVTAPGGTAAAAVPDEFLLHGSGYGHGVGMPQYGAYEMARQGHGASRILRYFYTGTGVGTRVTPSLINVQVFGPDPYNFSGYDDASKTDITVRGGRWQLLAGSRVLATGWGGTMHLSARDGDAVVWAEGKRYQRQGLTLRWSGTRYYRPSAAPAAVTVAGAQGTYRHGRLLLSESRGRANVVNQVRLNTEYLWGLAEMPTSWGTTGGREALRAQVVVARSYALLKRGHWKSACGCHVVDDVRDQNFVGWQDEHAAYRRAWIGAVSSTRVSPTRAVVLTSGGRPVEAHYYSSSGGRTANSEDVWSSALSHERSVADPYSAAAPGNRYASWVRVLTQSHARALFGLPDVTAVWVVSRYESGQVRTLRARSSNGETGTLTRSADQVRAAVGEHAKGGLPSSWIKRVTTR
jgi:stage II sporulation protein D